MHIGRFVAISENFKDPKIGEQTYKHLHNYLKIPLSVEKGIELRSIKQPNALQIFIGPKTSYSGKNIRKYMSEKTINKIKHLLYETDTKLVIHSNYLTQLSKLNKAGLNAVVAELRSAELLGAIGVVIHIGGGEKEELEIMQDVIDNAVAIIKEYNRRYGKNKGDKPKLIIETSSGKGTDVAIHLEDLGDIFVRIKEQLTKKELKMLGICIDTCHMFSAGYDFRSTKTTLSVFAKIDKHIGLKNITCIHFNDSSYEYNSRTDCHQNIGCGYIGSRNLGGSLDGFGVILLLAKQHKIPVILETPNRSECYPTNSVTQKHKKELAMVMSIGNTKKIIKDLKSLKLSTDYYKMVDYCT